MTSTTLIQGAIMRNTVKSLLALVVATAIGSGILKLVRSRKAALTGA